MQHANPTYHPKPKKQNNQIPLKVPIKCKQLLQFQLNLRLNIEFHLNFCSTSAVSRHNSKQRHAEAAAFCLFHLRSRQQLFVLAC